MTTTTHRILMTIGGLASGIGGIIATPGFEPLGIPAVAGAICAMTAAVAILTANTIRANWPSSQPN